MSPGIYRRCDGVKHFFLLLLEIYFNNRTKVGTHFFKLLNVIDNSWKTPGFQVSSTLSYHMASHVCTLGLYNITLGLSVN